MIVSFKDGFKLIGVAIVCFCAVFVCTFFINYYIDIVPYGSTVNEAALPLYTAQLATAKMTSGITGGFLSVIAIIMLLFYIKIYADNNHKVIGTLKAMGYSNYSIAKSFLIFGLSVFVGTSLGFAIGWAFMPQIYLGLTIEGLSVITPTFHLELLICLVVLPTIIFSAISYLYAFFILNRPALNIIKGEIFKTKNKKFDINKRKQTKSDKNRSFLSQICFISLKNNKILVFFVAFSCFCFSAMVQMGLSMEDLMSGTMGIMILLIGLVLSAVSMFMAMTLLVKNNTKNLAILKALGYSKSQRFISVFSLYIPFAIIAFVIGTVYQYGLLKLMFNLIFKDVQNVPLYSFNIKMFFVTLALFVTVYISVFAYYLYKSNKISVKEVMLDN